MPLWHDDLQTGRRHFAETINNPRLYVSGDKQPKHWPRKGVGIEVVRKCINLECYSSDGPAIG